MDKQNEMCAAQSLLASAAMVPHAQVHNGRGCASRLCLGTGTWAAVCYQLDLRLFIVLYPPLSLLLGSATTAPQSAKAPACSHGNCGHGGQRHQAAGSTGSSSMGLLVGR